MQDEKVYFNGLTPRGKYLTPPVAFDEVVQALLEKGWQAPPEWVLRWTEEHAVDDPRRKPVLEVDHPWNLAETGWGVIFAPDIDRRVRTQLEALLEHRRQQATGQHSHYYKDYEYRGESAFEFIGKHGGKPGMTADPEHIPYYLLLVGDPKSLPYKFQSELDVNHAVGRIFFEKPEHYAAYARSVVRAEEQSRPRSRDVVFFGTEHANDPPTEKTARDLVRPLAGCVLEPGMPWTAREIVGSEARKETLAKLLGGAETPAFLFAACHGMGFEEGDERQEDCQGALVCQDWTGLDDEGVGEEQWFAASDVAEQASLSGLVAFFYACYGVGTPQRDNFDRTTLGRQRPIAPHPLVARLPQRLLRHPEGGALAVIGHVDRAWTASFEGSPKHEGLGAFQYGLQRLLQGHTVGWAMEYLNQSYASLAAMLGNLDEEWRCREAVDKALYAHLWLVRNDARNFMVFGDPAVRLPGAGEPRR